MNICDLCAYHNPESACSSCDDYSGFIPIDDDKEDAELLRFWISEASRRPGRVATALANCVTPDDYRTALRRLRETEQ